MTRSTRFFPALCLLGLALGACSKKAEPTAAAPSPAPTPFLAARPLPAAATPRVSETTGTAPGVAPAGTTYEAWFAKYHLDLNDPKMLAPIRLIQLPTQPRTRSCG